MKHMYLVEKIYEMIKFLAFGFRLELFVRLIKPSCLHFKQKKDPLQIWLKSNFWAALLVSLKKRILFQIEFIKHEQKISFFLK